MDLTGARWGLEGAEAVLELRALHSNGDFDDYCAITSPRSDGELTNSATPMASSPRRHRSLQKSRT